jgi:hypothetical protein
MLGPGRYLLGVAELALLAGSAWLGAARVSARLLPDFRGAPAFLARSVIALALAIWVAQALGTVGLFEPVPYLLGVVAVGSGLRLAIRDAPTARPAEGVVGAPRTRSRAVFATAVALAIAALAVLHFSAGVKTRLSTGMTGFDSTWYHGPFAAGFFQGGDTWSLHFIAPQFLAWFYPANGEIFHAVGMLAFGRDLLSPLLNLGWFLGCLGAAWCLGRPFRVAPWSLALAAVALSVPALHDQAGEARNDLVGTFFLLAAVAVALNAWAGAREGGGGERPGLPTGALLVAGLAAGLAAGTKLDFLLPAAVLVLGLAALAPAGRRPRALLCAGLAALAGAGYWYLRNLAHAGNPLPWIHHLGPIALPAPAQALGGREAHSVLGYLTDGTVWSDWFLPGLRHGLWALWPVLAAATAAGLALALTAPLLQPPRRRAENPEISREIGPSASWGLALGGAVGVAVVVAWLVAPTSASGPEGMPRGFESGLRYLAPALVLGLALLPATPPVTRLLGRIRGLRASPVADSAANDARREEGGGWGGWSRWRVGAAALVLVAIVAGYPIQRHYLRNRYADPTFTTPGLDAAFRWARGIEDSRIATTSTRQYPLFGTDLSNRVAYVGVHGPHGGFEEVGACPAWRRALDAGRYDYVVATFDRIEPGNPAYPPQAAWTEGPGAEVVLRKPPTVVFRLTGRLDPAACPR